MKKLLSILAGIGKEINNIVNSVSKKFVMSKSIRAQLILAFVVPTILIVILGIVSYSNTSNTAMKLATQSSKTSMESSEKYLDLLLGTIEDQANQICTDSDVQEYFTKAWDTGDINDSMQRSKASNRINNKLQAAVSFNTSIKSAMILSNVDTASSFYTSDTFEDVKDFSIVKELEKDPARGIWFGWHKELDEKQEISSDSYSLSYIKLVRNLISSEPVGLLIIDLKPETVSDLVSGIDLGQNKRIYVVSHDGRVSFNGKTDEKSDITKQTFFQKIQSGKENNGTDIISYDGAKYLTTYHRVGESGIVLIGMIPEKDLNSAARQVILLTVIIVLAAVLIALGTGYLMANSMGQTISRIIAASELAASGDLSSSISSGRRDELGKLAGSINSMIANMRSLIGRMINISENVSSSAFIVSSTSEHVAAASAEISKAIQEISQGAAAQASDAEQGAEKISALAEKINRVTDNAREINDLTKDTMNMTHTGLSSVNELHSRADETTSISREIIKDIQELNVHSNSIGKIINVIGRIADQTNLLSLNAAIEAARAGESGKGFAVVANQVRNLAEQSMDATREISAIIRETQNMTANTVEKAAATEAIINSQNNALLNTIDVFKKIMHSMENLSVKVEHIHKLIMETEENKAQAILSIQNISAVSQETAASSEEVTASTQEQLAGIEDLSAKAEELKKAAEDLQQNIRRFKLD